MEAESPQGEHPYHNQGQVLTFDPFQIPAITYPWIEIFSLRDSAEILTPGDSKDFRGKDDWTVSKKRPYDAFPSVCVWLLTDSYAGITQSLVACLQILLRP